MVMRFDPFRDVDRLAQQLQSMSAPSLMAMDAYRRDDALFVHFDLPGVDPASIEITAEQSTLSVEAERGWDREDGDQIIAHERPEGRFSRQLMLGEHLDVDAIDASYEDGVLTLRIPIAESAKPRRVEVRGGSRQSSAIDVEGVDPADQGS